MTGGSGVVRTEVADRVATVRLDAPPVNALDSAMRDALAAAVTAIEHDDGIRAVVLWGGERCFAAGADIEQLASMGYEEIVRWNRAVQRTFTRVAELPVPVVAAVAGPALGGGLELALAADFRIVGAGSRLGLPEVQLGIMPGAGGTQRLTRLVGPARAKFLMMTGRRLTGAEAVELGVADEVVEDETVHPRALALARELAHGPRFALSAIKQAVDEAGGSAGLALERASIAGLFATEDKRRGLASFLREGPGKASFT
jgi:enoyl-CoA hydratase/carnithine racemase